MPIISDKPRLVPKASSPTRSLFSSVWQYSQNSSSKSSRSHSAQTKRPPWISSTRGVGCRSPYLPLKWSPAEASQTNVPSTVAGVVKTSPAGRVEPQGGLVRPLVLPQTTRRAETATILFPPSLFHVQESRPHHPFAAFAPQRRPP